MPIPIHTERLTLREFTNADAAAVQHYAADPDVVRFLPWGPNTAADTAAYLARCLGDQGATPRVNHELAVVRRTDDQLIGAAGLRLIRPDAAEGEVGYVLRRDCWGQGYMPEAVRGLLHLGFGTFELHRISATTDPQNLASARVLEKCGFQLEGCLRHHARVKGAWRHRLVFGLLADEFVPAP